MNMGCTASTLSSPRCPNIPIFTPFIHHTIQGENGACFQVAPLAPRITQAAQEPQFRSDTSIVSFRPFCAQGVTSLLLLGSHYRHIFLHTSLNILTPPHLHQAKRTIPSKKHEAAQVYSACVQGVPFFLSTGSDLGLRKIYNVNDIYEENMSTFGGTHLVHTP